MKKIISVLLATIMTLSLCAVPVFAAEDPLVITVANDTHLDLDASFAEEIKNSSNENAHLSRGGQLLYESYAILKSFLENAANNESDAVILPGDITNNGTVAEHEFLAEMLRDFEEATGKKVFVIAGNHDYLGVNYNEFKEIYADFGYNEATAVDPDSGSYIADINNEYSILGIDSCAYRQNGQNLTDERIDWIENQVKLASKEGKKVIAMLHHNLLEHFVLASVVHGTSFVTKDSKRIADVLADNGVKYVFSGHIHSHDIASYTSPNGNVVYDAVTNSLSQYPCAYRVVSFGEKVVFRTDYVRKIDTSLLPDGINEEALALAESNFLMYAKNSTYNGVKNMITAYTKTSQLKRILKTDDEAINALIERAAQKIEDASSMPIYKADAAEGENSLEAMAEERGITLPETDYETFIDLVLEVYQAQAEGDEKYASYTDEIILASRLFAITISYAFSDFTQEEFVTVLTYVASLLGVNISQDVIDSIGGAINKFEGAEIFVSAVLLPLLSQFGNDTEPSDLNPTLPGYETKEAEEEECFLDKIRAFFKKIFDFLHTLFAMIA